MCCWKGNDVYIKVWRPYLDDTKENHLITILKPASRGSQIFIFSPDNTMVTFCNKNMKGTLWSIDMNHKCFIKQHTDLSKSSLTK